MCLRYWFINNLCSFELANKNINGLRVTMIQLVPALIPCLSSSCCEVGASLSLFLSVPGQGLSCCVWNLFSESVPYPSPLPLQNLLWRWFLPCTSPGLPFFFFSDRLMLKMRLRQVMIKVLIVWCMIFVVQLLLHLKSRRDLIFELKIHSLLLKLFLLNVGRFSSVTILRKHACWSGRLGLIPLSSFSVKLYLGLCRVPCPWRACKFTGFSRQTLGHHMLAGVSGSLFLQFLSLASQVMM